MTDVTDDMVERAARALAKVRYELLDRPGPKTDDYMLARVALNAAHNPACGFCKGKPVGNARSWVDGKEHPPLPCPRCGELNTPASLTEKS